MSRSFSPATAEQVADVVEAVIASAASADVYLASRFADLPERQATAALELAADIGFLKQQDDGQFAVSSPLGHFLVTPNEHQKSAVIRVALEAYRPFTTFRERLVATGRVDEAARQTKALLDLDAHATEIKDTLVSLGTYARALRALGGGRYESLVGSDTNPLESLVERVDDAAAATALVRKQLGAAAVAIVSEDEVIAGLADGFLRAKNEDPDGAVFEAGNAVESYLERLADRQGVDVAGAHGINAKIDRLAQHEFLPTKLKNVGKYLGHIRNAADHGIDQEIGAEWTIASTTGHEYVFVACSLIAAITRLENGEAPTL